MANAPIQQPNIALPAAEWFSLSPNRTIAIQGRRAGIALSPFTAVAAGNPGLVNLNKTIESGWTNTSGIYLHDLQATFFPQAGDTSGELTITAFQVGLGTNAANAVDVAYHLGGPPSILTAPNTGNIISSDRDKLITAQDILALGEANTGVLIIAFQIGVFNHDAANPHSLAVAIQYVYSRLDGFTT